ncbi:hypothetical protein CYMTET_6180 [Cymbomonas tetramitiformis]|uniref:RanBP2-type domain-containing protein n=1 Tax=Cymbomonas tetramitiformis TaxID=36881 RepID=A0AAE0LIP1_9CHLO|nr:hypothetical protein CYMTET_6180 [Cymbomonas tetramitiformis]
MVTGPAASVTTTISGPGISVTSVRSRESWLRRWAMKRHKCGLETGSTGGGKATSAVVVATSVVVAEVVVVVVVSGMTPELMAAITAGHAQGGNMQASLAALQAYQAALAGTYNPAPFTSSPMPQQRPQSTSSSPLGSGGGSGSGGRPGDWPCKSSQVSNSQAVRAVAQWPQGGDGSTLKRPLDEEGPKANKPPKMVKAGDWTCTHCSNYNYAFRTQCKQCNAVKEEPAASADGGQATYVPEEAATF